MVAGEDLLDLLAHGLLLMRSIGGGAVGCGRASRGRAVASESSAGGASRVVTRETGASGAGSIVSTDASARGACGVVASEASACGRTGLSVGGSYAASLLVIRRAAG